MNKFVSAFKAFMADEDGLTAIEYGLMAAIIGAALVTGVTLMGTSLSDAFTGVGDFIKNKMPI